MARMDKFPNIPSERSGHKTVVYHQNPMVIGKSSKIYNSEKMKS